MPRLPVTDSWCPASWISGCTQLEDFLRQLRRVVRVGDAGQDYELVALLEA